VLNDKWESHPTWASEESGFISHKKNAFEEALYRSEEERYEYQFHIEAMGRTLSLLGPLLQKLEEMPMEGGTGFRLPPDLGSPTPSIHQRIIKKVYGREAGLEIIQALNEAPTYALPVVLPRLRQKDEEWRRGQSEFNKMWRDVDTRNFYKSLDHQGITFKANDKKAITTKAFVAQIESARSLALERGVESSDFGYHLDFTFSDIDVVRDAMKLCFCALDRQSMLYNRFERRCIERFMRSLVPLILKKDFMEFDTAFGSTFPSASEADMDSDGEAPNLPDGGEGRDGVASTYIFVNLFRELLHL
jgi:paired amphipathic helix protein Sin3a